VVKRRGEFFTREVKMNSKRELLNFVITYRAWVLPRSFDDAVRMLVDSTQFRPMPAWRQGAQGQRAEKGRE
jgi:hypothetical protein